MNLKNFGKTALSAIVAPVIAIGTLPILFRIYEPEAFGFWAPIQAVVLIITALCSLRMDLAVVVEADECAAKTLFAGTLVLALGVGVSTGVIVCAVLAMFDAHHWTATTLGWSALWLIAWLPQPTLQAWLTRHGRFGLAAASNATMVAGSNLAQLAFSRWSQDEIGLIAGSALAALGGAAIAMTPLIRDDVLGGFDLRCFRSLFFKHLRFLKYSLPFTALSLARERASVLLLTVLGSTAQVGFYSQASRIAQLPAGLAGAAIRPVIFQLTSREGAEAAAPQIEILVRGLALLCAPWIGFFLYDPAAIFTILLGPTWAEAGLFGALMIVPAFIVLLTGWLDRAVDALGRQDLNLKTELVASLGSVGVFAVLLATSQHLILATTAQSVMLTAAYLLFLAVTYRSFGLARWQLAKALVLAGAFAGAVALLAMLARNLSTPTAGLVTGAVAATVVSALVSAYLYRSISRLIRSTAND